MSYRIEFASNGALVDYSPSVSDVLQVLFNYRLDCDWQAMRVALRHMREGRTLDCKNGLRVIRLDSRHGDPNSTIHDKIAARNVNDAVWIEKDAGDSFPWRVFEGDPETRIGVQVVRTRLLREAFRYVTDCYRTTPIYRLESDGTMRRKRRGDANATVTTVQGPMSRLQTNSPHGDCSL